MLVHWIWLAECKTLNARTKWELVQHFSGAEDVFHADCGALSAVEGLSEEGREELLAHDLTQASILLDRCIRGGIHLLTIGDEAYPSRLKTIYDPPILLYYKGTLPDFGPAIAIVGTRHPSTYGEQTARRLGAEVTACGGLVVSGLAAGIDAAAMSGALQSGGPTVGVLGCGPDVVFPKSNQKLYDRVEQCGCILSEYAPGTQPFRWNFPKRNRIVSGLCCGVLVVEAPEKSGSLITARRAGDQGREVFVVPGNVDAAGFVGSNRLLRAGAIAVSSGWDIMSEYAAQFPGKVRKSEPVEQPEQPPCMVAQQPKIPVEKKELHKKFTKINIDNGSDGNYIDLNDILTGLTPDEQSVVRAITRPEQPVDELIEALQMSSGKILAILTMLEIKGKVVRHPGKRVSLSGKTN